MSFGVFRFWGQEQTLSYRMRWFHLSETSPNPLFAGTTYNTRLGFAVITAA
jgi:hypothetical protein